METLALWLIIAQLSPKCLETRMTAYKACTDKASLIGATCGAEPSKFQGVSLSVGKPKMEVTPGAESCIELLAVKVSSTPKKYTVTDWNKNTDKDARPIR